MSAPSLKLSIELIPKTCWGENLRKRISQAQWDILRSKVYGEHGNLCSICGASDRLNCHEVWSYDEQRLVQTLVGFRALCSMCHHVTHFGKASILAGQGQLDIGAVIAHFMKVNAVGFIEFEAHMREALGLWRERSKQQWQTDLGQWAALLEQDDA